MESRSGEASKDLTLEMAWMNLEARYQAGEAHCPGELSAQSDDDGDETEHDQTSTEEQDQSPCHGPCHRDRDQRCIEDVEAVDGNEPAAEGVHRDRHDDVESQEQDQPAGRAHEGGAHVDEGRQEDGEADRDQQGEEPEGHQGKERRVHRAF